MAIENNNIVRTEQLVFETNKGNYYLPAIFFDKPLEMPILVYAYPELSSKYVSFHSYGTTRQSMAAFCPFEIDDFYETSQEYGTTVYATSKWTASGDPISDTWQVLWPTDDGGVLFLGQCLLVGSDNMCYIYNGIGENTAIASEYIASVSVVNFPDSQTLGLAHINRDLTLTGTLTTLIPLERLPLPVNYAWQPVSHLSGNNGQFNMQLSQLDAAIIGDGHTAASSTDVTKYALTSQSSIYNMIVNIANNEETTIVYCGGNYCTVTRRFVAGTAYDLIYFTLKFYFRSGTLIYTSPEIDIRADHYNDRLFSMIFDNENEAAALDLITTIEGTNGIFYNNFALPSAEQMRALYIWLQDNGETHTSPYDTGTTDNGGDPSTPRPQDHITPSTLPTKGGLNTGLFTLYLPTDAQMSQIAAFLWSDNVLDNFKKYFNNFADNILACYSLPYTPANLSTKAFKVGNMVSDTITNVAYSQIRCFDIDMGSVNVTKLWDSYLDFAPFTKAEIYLPFIGLHSLDIDEIMCPTRLDGSVPDRLGTVLSLTYRLDILTGVVVAMLKVRVYTASGGYTDEIRYQFTGKVGYSIPLTGQTYANMTQGIVTALAGVATTIATGGLTAPMTAAAAVVGTVQASKPNVERIGNISGDASMLATNVPYLILASPNKPELIGQDKFTGFPSYKSGKLSEFSGYTEVLDAHVEGMNATETEKEMILNMLKGGVII